MPDAALVLVGRGRYQDPWHDDAATAHAVIGALAGTLDQRGVPVRVRGTSRDALGGAGPTDLALVVVCAGRGRADPDWDGDDTSWRPFHDTLAGLVAAGVPLLALHQAANTFADSPHWAQLLGGRWVVGTSRHPPIGPATFRVVDSGHPATSGLTDVEAYDERYCDLEVAPSSRVLAATEHEGRQHPVAWVSAGGPRVVYDGLGHDVRSYASPSRRELLRREVDWLLGGSAASSTVG
ncbi:ThuA domain-containing protein [uncultured Cellulomonas sp.]|uniref:ThuA domain-containing protein n=1 Tax=uncultured Cellulomonas sp. TaxID=189682 RepID=UPI00260D2A87|nr:ThuA domain-containing protein [uncultured Cellulomonas sp.]